MPDDPALASRRFWAYACAFGATWGTLEITVGSFVHALRVPLAGPALAAMGALLLVAQRQLLPARGLSLATGIIAALCKSLSPGGVILGPMVGISVEAVLIEVLLLAAPRALAPALLAGVLSVLWAVGQKVLNQYLLFGGNLLRLYVNAVERGAGWLGARASTGWAGVAALLGLMGALGAAGGYLGWRLGREARRRLDAEGGR